MAKQFDATTTQDILDDIERGDINALRARLDADPMLIYARYTAPDKDPLTALQIAARAGQVEACRLFVERGADVYTNPMNTYPPVIHAAWGGHQTVVDYFLREIPHSADGTNGLGVTINLAAREGWADLVRRHIEADPLSVHQRGWIGDTPLHWPAHNGYVDIVAMLLDAGADIEADEISCYGGKPLHWASEHAPATVELLLARGANVNSRNRKADSPFFGMTPLIMNATQKDDCAEVTRLLLDAGAETGATDAQRKTALVHAQERGLGRIVDTLLKRGAA